MPDDARVCHDCAEAIAASWTGMRFGTPSDLVRIEELQAEQRRANRQRVQEEQRAVAAAAFEHDAVTYYVATALGTIKIGTTTSLARRLREFRVALVGESLLAVEPGGREVERLRHDRFARWRVVPRREDFADAPDLRAHIADVRAEHGDPMQFLQPREVV